MIKDVVNTIIEAENKAEELLAKANQQAKEILLNGEKQIEDLKQKFSVNRKSEIKSAILKAEKKGEEKAAEIIKAGEAECAKLVKNSESKMQDAVNFVIERLVI